jgi:hypothetical protein
LGCPLACVFDCWPDGVDGLAASVDGVGDCVDGLADCGACANAAIDTTNTAAALALNTC